MHGNRVSHHTASAFICVWSKFVKHFTGKIYQGKIEQAELFLYLHLRSKRHPQKFNQSD